MALRNLEMTLQPDSWSCLGAATAMLIGRHMDGIYAYCGHDGSEIIWPDLPDPKCRRGFHLQEMFDIFLALGQHPVLIEALPIIEYSGTTDDPAGTDSCSLMDTRTWNLPVTEERFIRFLEDFPALLLGQHEAGTDHSVAWDGERCWDPRGQKYEIDDFDIVAGVFLM